MSTGLTHVQLAAWLTEQLASWLKWAGNRDSTWLSLPTGNPRFPSCGHIFAHAFTPLHRYADQLAGVPPVDDNDLDCADWATLSAWAQTCLERYEAVCEKLTVDEATRQHDFLTRSAGTIRASVGGTLFHAGTHCFWHLGGLAHLLRREGNDPPQRSDLLFWLMQHGL